jgi:ankyrin repeat protein
MADTVCHHGDTRAALALIESNADLEARASFYDSTPLHVASARGHSEIIAALVKSNADIDAVRFEYFYTPLCYAIMNNRAVDDLIESHANINHRTRDGSTPLYIACGSNNTAALKALLAAGADPELSSDTLTPLDEACLFGRSGMLKTLIAAGAVFANRSSDLPKIRQILADAAAPWSRDRHFLRGFPARSVIKTLLLVGLRRYSPAWHIVMVN